MPTSVLVDPAVKASQVTISFGPGKAAPRVSATEVIPGQGVIFQSDHDCIVYFIDEKLFGTHCAWVAANTSTVLYPVDASAHTKFRVMSTDSLIIRDGPGIGGGGI